MTDPSPLRPALFLHIQKTAGTSVQEMARQIYGNENVISHGDYFGLGVEACRKLPFVSGHFGFAFARALMAERFSFTFLRDPIDRLLSLYEFCRKRDPNEFALYAVAQQTDLDGFLTDAHGRSHMVYLWNRQVTQLAVGWNATMTGMDYVDAMKMPGKDLLRLAKTNLSRFDHVGFVKTFDADFIEIFDAIGAPAVKPLSVNVGQRELRAADLPASTRKRLEELTELDRALYDYAWRRYAWPAAIRRRYRGASGWLSRQAPRNQP